MNESEDEVQNTQDTESHGYHEQNSPNNSEPTPPRHGGRH